MGDMGILDEGFLRGFRERTEALWAARKLKQGIHGFQIQPGTRWNPGLSDDEIARYERDLSVRFSDEFKMLLRQMNGTDLETKNLYAGSGEPHRAYVGVYSYPRDLTIVRERVQSVRKDFEAVRSSLRDEGFDLRPDMPLVPFYLHRYVVCDPRTPGGAVLSILDADAVVYARDLRSYLEMEFLKG